MGRGLSLRAARFAQHVLPVRAHYPFIQNTRRKTSDGNMPRFGSVFETWQRLDGPTNEICTPLPSKIIF